MYTTYIIMCDLMYFDFLKKKVVSITVKKAEIKYLSNNIISVVYYICMLYVKKMVYNNCYLGLHVKYL